MATIIIIVLINIFSMMVDCPDYTQDIVVTASEIFLHVTPITAVTSPNYPLNYHDNLECTWRIQVYYKFPIGHILKVIFFDFELQQGQALSSISCPYDYLKFYDGRLVSSRLLGAYCGTVHPEVIYSTGRYLFVKFHTNGNSTFRGFNISVSVVKEGEVNKNF